MVTEELRKKELWVVNVFLNEIGWTKEVEGCPAFRGIIEKDNSRRDWKSPKKDWLDHVLIFHAEGASH